MQQQQREWIALGFVFASFSSILGWLVLAWLGQATPPLANRVVDTTQPAKPDPASSPLKPMGYVD